MPPFNREQPRTRGFETSMNRNTPIARRNVPIQPKEGSTGSRAFDGMTTLQQTRYDAIPAREREKTLNFSDLSIERQQKINELSRLTSSWENLAINAAGRGESLPQTRQRALNSLIRAANPDIPLDKSSPPNVAIHSRRIHDPEPRSSSTYRNDLGSRSSSHANRRGTRKKDSGKAVEFIIDWNKSSDQPPTWYDVVDVDWKDRNMYRVPSGAIAGESPASEGSSHPSRKKKKDAVMIEVD